MCETDRGEYFIAKYPDYVIGRSDVNASEVYMIDTIDKVIKYHTKKSSLIAY